MSLVKEFIRFDLGINLVMREHMLSCHPFVGKYFLRVGRYSPDESDDEPEECVSGIDESDENNESVLNPTDVPRVYYDVLSS